MWVTDGRVLYCTLKPLLHLTTHNYMSLVIVAHTTKHHRNALTASAITELMESSMGYYIKNPHAEVFCYQVFSTGLAIHRKPIIKSYTYLLPVLYDMLSSQQIVGSQLNQEPLWCNWSLQTPSCGAWKDFLMHPSNWAPTLRVSPSGSPALALPVLMIHFQTTHLLQTSPCSCSVVLQWLLWCAKWQQVIWTTLLSHNCTSTCTAHALVLDLQYMCNWL